MVLNLARSAALLSLAAPGALAAVHQHHASVPKGWSVAKLKADSTSTFTLALTMQNIDKLDAMMMDVASPRSANYGKFKTDAEVQSLFAPSKDAVDSVTAWLTSNGITNYRVDGAFIDFAMDIETANRVFQASYQRLSDGETTKLRTLSFAIPDELEQHIQYLDPSTYIGTSKAFRPTPQPFEAPFVVPTRADKRSMAVPLSADLDPSCEKAITPACLKDMYNVGDYVPDVSSGSRIGFASFLNQSAIYSDVALFEQQNNIPSQGFAKVLIAGGVDDQDPANNNFGEANLDAECIIGMAHPLPVTEYITGGSPYVSHVFLRFDMYLLPYPLSILTHARQPLRPGYRSPR
jgi:tripeptidyl-peptidase-1